MRGWSTIVLLSGLLPHVADCQTRPGQAANDARFQQQAERLEPAVYRNPRPGTAFDLWIQLYQDAGSLDQLEQRTRERCEAKAGDYRAHLVRGLVCERLGRTDKALAAYRIARDLDGQQQLTRLLLGSLLQQQQQWEAAAEELSAGLPLTAPRQDQLQLARQLAAVYQRLGQPEQAVGVWRQIADRFSGDARVLTELATRLQHDGQADAALSLWQTVRKLVAHDPAQRVQVDTQLAQLHLQQQHPEQALQVLQPLLDQVLSDDWQAQQLRGLIEQAVLDQHGAAGLVDFWTERVRARPDDLSAQVQLAQALARADRLPEAQQQFAAILQRAPPRRELRQAYLDLLRGRGEFQLALEQAQALADTFPQDTEVWMQLGQLHLQVAETDPAEAQRRAVAAWQQMVTLRPDDASLALQAVQACRAAVQDPAGGADRSLPQEPLSAGLRQGHEELLQAAEQFCREAIRRDPSATTAQESLGELLHWLGRPDEAVAAWMALSRPGTAAAWHDTARILERFGYLDRATFAAAQAAQSDPGQIEYAASGSTC